MLKKIKCVPYLAGLVMFGCQSDSTTDLQNAMGPIDVVSYNVNVKPIISSNCIQCHADTPQNGAPMRLTTYDAVKDAVLNRGLIDRISRPEGVSGHMPLGGPKLPETTINLIRRWQEQGFPE